MSHNIEGKVVVITGASSGLGEATARTLSAQGTTVVLGARREDRIQTLARELIASGGKAIAVTTDVTDRAQVKHLVDSAVREYGRVDVMINNAGLMPQAPLERLKIDEWERMIDVNIKGVLYGIAAALPVFRRQGFGHIINTASTAAFRVVPSQSVYAGTKMAVRAISEGLRQEAGPHLRVTIVSPGITSTDFADSMTDPDVRAQLEQARDAMAMPPDAVARAIAFAIEQPATVDVGEIVVRPTAQS
jgi:NADP-dependent 3-hydroxy acid dehydrogenase YdfG